MINMHKLRELLLAALSLGTDRHNNQWSTHLEDAFNAFLGGVDVFRTGPVEGYILMTIFDRNEVMFGLYRGNAIVCLEAGNVIRKYGTVGAGSFSKCILGNTACVRDEIERSYQRALEMLGPDEFKKTFGKNVPYAALHDRGLININNGVVDHVTGLGISEDPLTLTIPVASRLHAKQYYDIRQYDDADSVMNGLFGAWSALVSSSEKDWTKFSTIVRSVFQ